MAGSLVAALLGQGHERPVLERDRLGGLLAGDGNLDGLLLPADADGDRGRAIGQRPGDGSINLHDAGVAGRKGGWPASGLGSIGAVKAGDDQLHFAPRRIELDPLGLDFDPLGAPTTIGAIASSLLLTTSAAWATPHSAASRQENAQEQMRLAGLECFVLILRPPLPAEILSSPPAVAVPGPVV